MQIKIEVNDTDIHDLILVLSDTMKSIRYEKFDARKCDLTKIDNEYRIFKDFAKQAISQMQSRLIETVGTFDSFIQQLESKQNEN